MVTVDHARSAASAIALIALLAGCSAAPPPAADDYPDLSLAETKSSVQLLRNAAETLIDAETVESTTETDASVPCLDPADDPTGEIRRWLSTTEVRLVRWHAWRVGDVADILIDTFVDKSWYTIDDEPRFGGEATLLTSSGSANEVRVEAVGSEDDATAVIHVTVTGPCVRTAGDGSEELAALE